MELIDSYNVVRKDLNGISEKYKYTGKETYKKVSV